jgi:putative FmdB family regulatory protein
MPIYEYQCQACGHEYEALQKISDQPLTQCPACHKSELVKKISAAGFRLKGVGWYETDFKSGNKKNVAGEGGGSAAAPAATATGCSGGGCKNHQH